MKASNINLSNKEGFVWKKFIWFLLIIVLVGIGVVWYVKNYSPVVISLKDGGVILNEKALSRNTDEMTKIQRKANALAIASGGMRVEMEMIKEDPGNFLGFCSKIETMIIQHYNEIIEDGEQYPGQLGTITEVKGLECVSNDTQAAFSLPIIQGDGKEKTYCVSSVSGGASAGYTYALDKVDVDCK